MARTNNAADLGERLRLAVVAVVAIAVFIFAWFFRFNDPGGSFAGLTDDHFFYLVRGWQILFGDLPVRDFVDHGAPLYYYVAAAVQVLFGRGTLSELAFSATALALGAALTFALSARASGSVLAGLAGVAFQILLVPRFYNYPKILVYVAAIPVLWWFADRPGSRSRACVAAVTVIAFLFRHDHGAFVGLSMAVTLLLMAEEPWQARIRHAVLYGALVLALVAPYLLFIQVNGGLASYLQQASAWAERDRGRAPVVWPGVFDNPDGVSEAAKQGGVAGLAGSIRDNSVAWTYYLEMAIPLLALGVLALTRDATRPRWPHARAKIGMVAVLALVLDAGFLRSPLAARLADPSVPLAILVAWLIAATLRLLIRSSSWQPGVQSLLWPIRVAVLVSCSAVVFILWCGLTFDFYRRLDKAGLVEGWDHAVERVGTMSAQLRADWDLETWVARPDRPDLISLAMYVNACTAPDDRIFVQGYMPQVLGLARRAFAGGHADLRPGFFATDDAQQLTIARLRRQSVPIVLLDTDKSYQEFRKAFPLLMAYLDSRYQLAGTRVFDDRFGVNLFVQRDVAPSGTYEPFGWPCYGPGRVTSSAKIASERTFPSGL